MINVYITMLNFIFVVGCRIFLVKSNMLYIFNKVTYISNTIVTLGFFFLITLMNKDLVNTIAKKAGKSTFP